MPKTRMMLLGFGFTAAFFASPLVPAARALNIQDIVVDKLDNGVEGAKVCLAADTGHCVLTDELGEFALTDGSIAVRHPGQGGAAFRLESGGNGLTLYAPFQARARMQWLDAGGRTLPVTGGLGDRPLAEGRNLIPLPDGMRNTGLCFLRVYLSDRTLTWKTVLLGGSASATPAVRNASGTTGIRTAFLSKVQAGPAGIVISKTGYKTRTYRPFRETETGEYIVLTAANDDDLSYTLDIVTRVTSLDTARKAIVSQSVDTYCEGSSVISDTLTDSTVYAIRNGKMYVWAPGDCFGTTLAGSSPTPVGTWTLSQVNTDLPADLKVSGCVPDSSEIPVDDFDYQAIYDITATKITAHLTLHTCPSNSYRENFEGELHSDPSVTVTKATCKELEYRNGAGQTAKVVFSQSGDSLHSVFTYGSKTCDFAQDVSLSEGPVSCPENDDPYTPHYACLEASGFATAAIGPGLAKAGAAPSLPMSKLQPEVPGKAAGLSHGKLPARPRPFFAPSLRRYYQTTATVTPKARPLLK